jgi:hypothetical protein
MPFIEIDELIKNGKKRNSPKLWGDFCKYKGKIYCASINREQEIVTIYSKNPEERNDGFVETENFKYTSGLKKQMRYAETEEIYEICAHPIYKGKKYDRMGSDTKITLFVAANKIPKETFDEEVKKLLDMGFEECYEQYGSDRHFIKPVPLDDPDLEVIEERVDYYPIKLES